MQIAQYISSRMYVKKRRRSGLRRGFLACIIGEIDKPRCVRCFSADPNCDRETNAALLRKNIVVVLE